MKKIWLLGLLTSLTFLGATDSFGANYTCQRAGLGKAFLGQVKSQVKAALTAANISFKKVGVKVTDAQRDTLTVNDTTTPQIPITVTATALTFGTIPDIVPPQNQACEVTKNIQVTIIRPGAANIVGSFTVKAAGRYAKTQ